MLGGCCSLHDTVLENRPSTCLCKHCTFKPYNMCHAYTSTGAKVLFIAVSSFLHHDMMTSSRCRSSVSVSRCVHLPWKACIFEFSLKICVQQGAESSNLQQSRSLEPICHANKNTFQQQRRGFDCPKTKAPALGEGNWMYHHLQFFCSRHEQCLC